MKALYMSFSSSLAPAPPPLTKSADTVRMLRQPTFKYSILNCVSRIIDAWGLF
jgi:hypothetical protein